MWRNPTHVHLGPEPLPSTTEPEQTHFFGTISSMVTEQHFLSTHGMQRKVPPHWPHRISCTPESLLFNEKHKLHIRVGYIHSKPRLKGLESRGN